MSSLFLRLAHKYLAASVTKSAGLRLAFDVEANGFLDTATVAHCVVIADLDSDQIHEYGPEQITDALAHLARASYLTGHNIQNYDLPLLRQLYGWEPPASVKIIDTLVAGRLILPNIGDIDDQVGAMGGPKLKKLRGRFSLEAWGVRLGVAKVGAELENFSVWTPELQARCAGDVRITVKLWRFLQPDGCSAQAMELEHRVNPICNCIEATGVPFDDAAAERLERQWTAERNELKARLLTQFPGMNPTSRKQIGVALEARGWIPEERTEKTKQPKIDDEVLETIAQEYPEFADLSKLFTLGKRLAALSTGDKAWRKHIGADGRIHGGIVHIGTPHSRASHAGPNLAQVPNPKRGTAYANECRALFRAPKNWVFVDADQATLQDRCFGHYLTAFDGGAYAKAFLAGADQHWKGAIVLDLIAEGTERDKQNAVHTVAREGAKGFRYGFLFGCQAKRAGRIVYKIVRSIEHADPTNSLRQKFFAGSARPNESALQRIGGQALVKFEAGTPGLQQLRQKLREQAHRYGWLSGLDGRRVPVRALYSALNFIVTSAEAIACKRWLVQTHDELCARFRYGWDGDVVIAAWIHDSFTCCCRSEIAAEVGEIMVRHARAAGEFYELKVPLDAAFTIGRTWAIEPTKDESRAETSPHVEAAVELPGDQERTACESQKFSNDSDDEPESESPEDPAEDIVIAVLNELPPAAPMTSVESTSAPEALPWEGKPQFIISTTPISVDSFEGFTTDVEGRTDGKILCPFHQEKTPSCQLYADGHYHCFGCGAHGQIDDDMDGVPDSVLAQALDAENDTKTLDRGLELWAESKPITGTLAEHYLTITRRLDLTQLPASIEEVLRFHPRCPFGANGARHPCLIALFRDVESDEPAGIHRIGLTTGAAKIKRLTLGRWPGVRAIKLWPITHKLTIGEGIETVLGAIRCGAITPPAWAMGPKADIANFPMLPGVKAITVLVDRGDPAALDGAEICAARYTAAGIPARWLRTAKVKDFNDLLVTP
jgi:DNA polymerase I-like protein with 3'-5' exonuclease and polymerase domains